MKTLNKILLASCAMGVFLSVAAAQDGDAQLLMNKMAGVYKHRFMSATITPGKRSGEADVPYEAEDIIEIVPFDADHVYLHAHLESYNGHSCDFFSMARYERGEFVYRDPELPREGARSCTLRVGIEGGKLTLTDRDAAGASTCSRYCGTRADWIYAIGLGERQAIRDVERLKASSLFKQAAEESRKTER